MLDVLGIGTVSFANIELRGFDNHDCAMEQIEAIILGHADPVVCA